MFRVCNKALARNWTGSRQLFKEERVSVAIHSIFFLDDCFTHCYWRATCTLGAKCFSTCSIAIYKKKPNPQKPEFGILYLLFCSSPPVLCRESIFSPPRGRNVNLMTLAKCVCSGYCIDYMVTLSNRQAQRPRDLERTETNFNAGYRPHTRRRLRTWEHHAGQKLLCLPQGSTSEVCLSGKMTLKIAWLFCCCCCCYCWRCKTCPCELELRESETAGQHYALVCWLN